MIPLLILAIYAVNALLTVRITLRRLVGGTEIEGDDWFLAVLAGLIWPIVLVGILFYLAARPTIRPLLIPPAVRRAEQERKRRRREEARRDAEVDARKRAREHGLPYPEDGDG